MARPRRYTPAKVAEAVRSSRGLLTLAARRLGCDRHTVLRYAEHYPTVAAALSDAREQQIDVAEAKLFEAIDGGELAAITFYLRTVGRHRGYGDRTEVAVDGRVAVEAEAQQARTVLMLALQPFPEAKVAAAAALMALASPAAPNGAPGARETSGEAGWLRQTAHPNGDGGNGHHDRG